MYSVCMQITDGFAVSTQGRSRNVRVPPWDGSIFFFIMGSPILWKLENRGCPLPEKLKNMGRCIFGAKIWYVVKIW